MSKSRRLGLIVGGALFLAGVVFVFLYEPDTTLPDKPPPVRPAKTAIVRSAGRSVARNFTGSVLAQDQVELAFRVSGPLVQLPVRASAEVKEGDLIAQIDPRDFQRREARVQSSLDQARAALSAMRAGARAEEIARLESQVTAAKAEFSNAENELGRMQKLLDDNIISQSEFDRVLLSRETAREKLRAAEQELGQGRAGARPEDIDAQEALIRGLEVQLHEAQDALSDTTLRAPFDGVIARRFVENFQDVDAKERIVSVRNLSHVRVVANVPEAVVAMVRQEHVERMTVAFGFDPSTEYDVRVSETDLEADRRTRTYAVTVTLPAPKTSVVVLPGMSASLRVYLNEDFVQRGGGIPVPAGALFTDDKGNSFVWVVGEDLRVRQRQVVPDEMTTDHVIVTGGLEDGDRVVTAGVHMVEEGWEIRLIDEPQAN